ncbi:MAG: spore protease YyaC, partial [Clostridia bacterium]|nr:spore protease YyaC [Clostridia bacterium]
MNFVIICIGSDKISGDALGPVVGGLLRNKYKLPCPVYGTEQYPVNGVNLPDYRNMLDSFHVSSSVVAVDAAVGEAHEIGRVKIRSGGIKAGGALNSPHKMLGDIGILGVVAEKCDNVLGALLETPFALIEEMAERIALSIA